MHAFLLIGQSNMAGRGAVREAAPIVNERVFVLREDGFRVMKQPVNPDCSSAGVNLAESFADRYQRETGEDVGLIPCAEGNTSIQQWQKGEALFENACRMTERAAQTAEIRGILWHQGEADCGPSRYPYYKERLGIFLDDLQRELHLENVPVLLGGLGDFLADCELSEYLRNNYQHINRALRETAAQRARAGFVNAAGLGANSDNLHFNAAALREFGLRYYDEYIRIR